MTAEGSITASNVVLAGSYNQSMGTSILKKNDVGAAHMDSALDRKVSQSVVPVFTYIGGSVTHNHHTSPPLLGYWSENVLTYIQKQNNTIQ